MAICLHGNVGGWSLFVLGVHVDTFDANQKQAALQSCLIRLGKTIRNLDGQIGKKTQKALVELGIPFNLNNIDNMLIQTENLVQQKFPSEFVTPFV